MSDRLYEMDLYCECLEGWAEMYVGGTWTLEKFEAHADLMREQMFGRCAKATA